MCYGTLSGRERENLEMATIARQTWSMGQLESWLMGRKEKVTLYLTSMGYQTGRRVIIVQNGEVGYYLNRKWVRLQRGDVVQLRNMDVEIR